MGAATVAVALILAAGPAWAKNTYVIISKGKDLKSGQVVKVKWHGFATAPAKGGLTIIECTTDWRSGIDQCDSGGSVHVAAPIDSKGLANFTVRSGVLNAQSNATCGTTAANNNCVLIVTEIDKHGKWVSAYTVPTTIEFKLS